MAGVPSKRRVWECTCDRTLVAVSRSDLFGWPVASWAAWSPVYIPHLGMLTFASVVFFILFACVALPFTWWLLRSGIVDFPEQKSWSCDDSELEVVRYVPRPIL